LIGKRIPPFQPQEEISMGTQDETDKPRKGRAITQGFADPLERLTDEMDRLFNSYFRGVMPRLGFGTAGEGALLAHMDVSETPETVDVVIDVPGIKEKDIDVSLTDSALLIKGKRESQSEEKKKNYHRVERSYGEFQRRIALPCEVDGARVEAKLKDGVLTVTLPKSAKALEQERKIPIKAA
jgi:HSP20 family protein